MASRPSQILVWSWWMLSLVLAAAYSGTLTAFLSSSQQPLLFSRPQDLLTKTHTYTWGTIRDNTMSIFLESSKDPLYRQTWSNIQHFAVTDPEVLTANTTALVSKVCHEDFVLIMDYVSALDLFRIYNDVIIVSADIRTVMFGLVVPKGSAPAASLSNVIRSLQSSGQLSQWTDKWFPRKPSTTAAPGPMVISLPHVLDVLHVLPVLVGLALGIMTLEVIYVRWKKT